MIGDDEPARDLASLAVPQVGSLAETGDVWEPYRLLDPAGVSVAAVAVFLKDLQAAGRSAATQRSYSMALLRWLRFLWAVGVPWDQATRVEARDFSLWIQGTGKQARPGLREEAPGRARAAGAAVAVPGMANAVTGKRAPGRKYASATLAHGESVLRGFYDFHCEAGTGPMVNPFPLARDRRGGRAHAHQNPMGQQRNEKTGLYRPKLTRRAPRRIPDEKFNELFALLPSHRDRALAAFWVSTGARASELLGASLGDADAGQQLITVIRKGSRRMQQLPASPDAFVWLRLYQAQMQGLVPAGPDQPLWWTLRRPFRQLSYHAAYRMFSRVNAALGANWSPHDLRHTAAYRMARDPDMPLTDVQWVLGHAQLTTTQLYLAVPDEDVIASVLAHHARRAAGGPADAPPAGRYRPESMSILFGQGPA